jgi:hypothetical protein
MTSSELLGETRYVEREDVSPVVSEALAQREWSDAAIAALHSWVRRQGEPQTVDQCVAFLEYIEASEITAEAAVLARRTKR